MLIPPARVLDLGSAVSQTNQGSMLYSEMFTDAKTGTNMASSRGNSSSNSVC